MLHQVGAASPSVWLELTRLIPSVLWFLFTVIVIWKLWPYIKRDVIPNLTGFKGFGLELTFARVQLDQAAAERVGINVSANDRSQVLRRASAAGRVLTGMRILWVDDNLKANESELHLLKSLGMYVDQVTSTADALLRLGREKYDAVISDIERGDEADAGIRMVSAMWDQHAFKWTVFYVTRLEPSKPLPPHAFAVTNRPDHLLHFLIDIAERARI